MIGLPGSAQTGIYYSTDDVLPNSMVNQIYQDNYGYIWISTEGGLCAYDGYQFATFQHDAAAESSIKTNYVTCVAQDRNDVLYVGTSNGIQITDGEGKWQSVPYEVRPGETFDSYFVSCILCRRNGQVLVGTSGYGVMRMGEDGGGVRALDISADANPVVAMAEDEDGWLWVVTTFRGIMACRDSLVRSYLHEEATAATLQTVCIDGEGRIFVGSNKGLYQYDKRADTFRLVPQTSGLNIVSLRASERRGLLVGTNCDGLFILDKGQLIPAPYHSNDVDLRRAKVYSILEDRAGNVWLGLLQKGVFMHPAQDGGFRYFGYRQGPKNPIGNGCVMATLYAPDGTLYVGTDGDGIYAIDSAGQLLRHYDRVPRTVLCLTMTSDGRLWMGGYGDGCGEVDLKTGQYHRLDFSYGPLANVFGLDVDGRGNLWVGAMGGGVVRYHPQTRQQERYLTRSDNEDPLHSNSICNDFVYTIKYSTEEDRVYVCTTSGLSCYDFQTDSWLTAFGRNRILEAEGVQCVLPPAGNRPLWVGTADKLCRYDKDGTLHYFTTAEGLPSNNIVSLTGGEQDELWVATTHGLSRMRSADDSFENFFASDGLQGNEFSRNAATQVGRLLAFGGTGGVTLFDPGTVRYAPMPPTLYLSEMRIGGVPVTTETRSGWHKATQKPVMETDYINLSHNDNSFSLFFTALTYGLNDRVQIQYSINEGLWQTMDAGKNELQFSHLGTGTYHFQVRATDGRTLTDTREFTIRVQPPWYLSIYAYLFYLAVLAIAIWRYFLWRRHREQQRLLLQESIHAEQMQEQRLQFFMNMGHEIRTPLTLIVSPLEVLMREDEDPARSRIYHLIRRNAERILNTVTQMLDIHKIDKGQMQIHREETDLIGFIGDLVQTFQPKAQEKRITFAFHHDGLQTLPMWIDRQAFDKVMMNVLSNAFKFTGLDGHIDITVEAGPQTRITVADDGEQIPADKLESIFQRFYQVPGTAKDRYTGTGIGLDLARSLVELHHGTIHAENLPERGCLFVIEIPAGNPAPIAEESAIASEQLPQTGKDMPTAEAAHAHSSQKRRRLKVLIAEDDHEIREYLTSELQKEFDITATANGREALDSALQQGPDLLITDITMPEMDGLELLARVRSNINISAIPVILLTARDSDDDRIEGMDVGADAYITKPFNIELLRRTTMNLIHSRQMLANKFSGAENLNSYIDVQEPVRENPDERLLQRVMAVINAHLSDPELDVEAITHEVGISRAHLHRKMKELTNQSMRELIRNVRLKQAADLLLRKRYTVAEVMDFCGFSSPSSFATQFKNFYGVSPSEFMKRNQAAG
ncbi:MAG: response regulator [Bacteroidaceae bacterium]|nr:response regulator [Bacteroidaceae bacterium]